MNLNDLAWSEDGLAVNFSGSWAKEKYALLSNYIEMFSSGMLKKWGKRVYIDLYSGPGCTQLRESGVLLKGSPLIALSVKDPFDKYIFCEENPESLEALKNRCLRGFPTQDISFVEGDCNANVEAILEAIPPHSTSQTVLTFCFVDPFSLDLHFETIEKLSTKFVDFLVLLALDMDARRNLKNYLSPSSKKIDLLLGSASWRDRWERFSSQDNSFQRFLAHEFEVKMLTLGYKKHSKGNTKHISTRDGTLPLYHLAFFSRHPRGYAFWDECLKYGSPQGQFEF
jgi:three-Cys-motif partner protein